MATTQNLSQQLLREMQISASELKNDIENYEQLIQRFGGRSHLLNVASVDVQKQQVFRL